VRGREGRIAIAQAHPHQLGLAVGLAQVTLSNTLHELDAERPDSDLSKLNRVASTVRLQVSQNTFRVIDLAIHYAGLTGGAFDITAAPLHDAWGFGVVPAPDAPPSPELLEASRKGVGAENVQLFDQGSIAYTTPMTRLALGDLAPAYAVDLAIVEMRRRGIGGALLAYGPAVRALGESAPERPWYTDLEHPFLATQSLGRVDLRGGAALVAINLYDQTVTLGGRTFGHILDPRSGQPVEDTVLVAVRGPTATKAYALAYALAVLGVQDGAGILAEFPRYEALAVPNRAPLQVWQTRGFAAHFRPSPGLEATLNTWIPRAVDDATPTANAP